jgi:hypothetical protein
VNASLATSRKKQVGIWNFKKSGNIPKKKYLREDNLKKHVVLKITWERNLRFCVTF